MKFLFASDSFKGTLSSNDTIRILAKTMQEVFADGTYTGIPVADGGEGTVEAVISALKGRIEHVQVNDPLMRPVTAEYGLLGGSEAIMEMASASGLPLLKDEERNPLETTTYGTGEVIRKILDEGCRTIYIAIGGSATNDGGIGAMRALGVRFLDEEGNELEGRGKDLNKIREIDDSGLDRRLADTKIVVLSDVTNPLTGKDGATYTFGKQKGGTEEILRELEQGMENYRQCLIAKYGRDPNELKGGGAAGGLGTALGIFLKGTMRSGIETVLDLVHFDEAVQDCDYVITGEGRTDWQSAFGKVVQGVGDRAKKYNVKVVDLCGSVGEGYEKIREHGITEIITTSDSSMTLEYALSHAEELYEKAALKMFEKIRNDLS